MKSMKQNLQAVSKELKALAKKTEVLMKELNKLEKSQPATKPKTKAVKARVPKKAPVKKKAKGLTDTISQHLLFLVVPGSVHAAYLVNDQSSYHNASLLDFRLIELAQMFWITDGHISASKSLSAISSQSSR